MNITIDTLITSLISQIGLQLQILKHNLNQITVDSHNRLNDSSELQENNALQAVDIEKVFWMNYYYELSTHRSFSLKIVNH